MIMLTCSCLNVRVHTRGSALNLQDPSDAGVPKNVQTDSFFSSKIYVCTLDLAGVTMSQQRLCKERLVDDWSITTCVCCMMDVFAKHAYDNDKVYVSMQAQTDPVHISSLMESVKYSSLFKLILPEINDNFIQNIGVEFHNGNIGSSIEVVQSQVSNYLKEEQRAMEIRIRQYNDEQQLKYNNLLQQVRKHKQAMVYLMLKCKESGNSHDEGSGENSLGSSSALNRDSANESSASTDSAFDRSETSEIPTEEIVKQQRVRSLRRTVSNPSRSRTKGKRELKRAPASIDVGGVFDMEEFETKEESFSGVSDGDSEDSESESTSDFQKKGEERSIYGNSLPMSIPAFTKLTRHPPIDDEEEKESPPKVPIDIAASIRALACSVRDGTEMFGELPRRRLNTGELLSSRPF
ncbi:uncharacterized protein [Parasteatoda tepidariorum]|uniref:uncharacterized protein isoform X2 n=1 Tax=Parasteatoda tepidariorum TaxID=114398 RepID=UPI00077FB79E|nr:uncharacterized protein LOC107444734 isoform X2 [Parasteatoda tepidariorum]